MCTPKLVRDQRNFAQSNEKYTQMSDNRENNTDETSFGKKSFLLSPIISDNSRAQQIVRTVAKKRIFWSNSKGEVIDQQIVISLEGKSNFDLSLSNCFLVVESQVSTYFNRRSMQSWFQNSAEVAHLAEHVEIIWPFDNS